MSIIRHFTILVHLGAIVKGFFFVFLRFSEYFSCFRDIYFKKACKTGGFRMKTAGFLFSEDLKAKRQTDRSTSRPSEDRTGMYAAKSYSAAETAGQPCCWAAFSSPLFAKAVAKTSKAPMKKGLRHRTAGPFSISSAYPPTAAIPAGWLSRSPPRPCRCSGWQRRASQCGSPWQSVPACR